MDTPANRSVAEKSWAENRIGSHLEGLTTFKFGANNSPDDILIRKLYTIELHHGEYSANPLYTVLEVIGTPATARLKGELSRFGFNQFQDTAEGFCAIRPLPTDVVVPRNCRSQHRHCTH